MEKCCRGQTPLTRLPGGRVGYRLACQWVKRTVAQICTTSGVDLPEVETEVATEEEDAVAEPTYAFARGFGRFVIRYTRLATALGNFEQGSIQTESTAVAYWLTSGLKVAMARVGWNLLSPRYGLTRLPGELLKRYYSQGYPQLQEEDRPYHQYGPIVYTEDRWDELLTWLSGDPMLRKNLARYKQELRRQQGAGRDDSGARNKSRRTIPPPGSSSSSSAAHPPNRSQPPLPPPPHWWWQ